MIESNKPTNQWKLTLQPNRVISDKLSVYNDYALEFFLWWICIVLIKKNRAPNVAHSAVPLNTYKIRTFYQLKCRCRKCENACKINARIKIYKHTYIHLYKYVRCVYYICGMNLMNSFCEVIQIISEWFLWIAERETGWLGKICWRIHTTESNQSENLQKLR